MGADYGLPADIIKGGFATSGLFDLNPLRYSFLQAMVQIDQQTIQRESPLFNLPAHAPPMHASVGGAESDEFRRQSASYVDAWQAAGLVGAYSEQPGRNHFTAITDFAEADSPLCKQVANFIEECERN